jgi:16S rRNA (guanine(966)-N(2))-methyltransferase RsmD
VRIIAGELGGRVLVAPAGRATRPTSERVREALFSILGDVAGLAVLDLFAGSGALGLEALSRGAARAVLVEQARPALKALQANVRALGLADRARVVAAPAERALSRLAGEGERFGLAFLDPPYAGDDGARALAALVAQGVLASGAWIVLERATRGAPLAAPPGYERAFERAYGDTTIGFYRPHAEAS